MSVIVFNCSSGIAGNLWSAALIGVGADPNKLKELPGHLRFDWIEIESNIVEEESSGKKISSIEITGDEKTPTHSYQQMISKIEGLPYSSDILTPSLQIFKNRQTAEAKERGLKVEDSFYKGTSVADTLIDIVGGVLCWDDLGRPQITTKGPVVLGNCPPQVPDVLKNLPTETGDLNLELTTPTGAALLEYFWEDLTPKGKSTNSVYAPGDFSRAGVIDELYTEFHKD